MLPAAASETSFPLQSQTAADDIDQHLEYHGGSKEGSRGLYHGYYAVVGSESLWEWAKSSIGDGTVTLLHFMICHSKKCHRPRTSSCDKKQQGGSVITE